MLDGTSRAATGPDGLHRNLYEEPPGEHGSWARLFRRTGLRRSIRTSRLRPKSSQLEIRGAGCCCRPERPYVLGRVSLLGVQGPPYFVGRTSRRRTAHPSTTADEANSPVPTPHRPLFGPGHSLPRMGGDVASLRTLAPMFSRRVVAGQLDCCNSCRGRGCRCSVSGRGHPRCMLPTGQIAGTRMSPVRWRWSPPSR